MVRIIIKDDGHYLTGAERNRLLEHALLSAYDSLDKLEEVKREVRLQDVDRRLIKETIARLRLLTKRIMGLKKVYT